MNARWSAASRPVVATGAAVALVTVCGTLLGAAALTPRTRRGAPLVIVACLGCPMLATLELGKSISELGGDRRAVEELRRQLRRLPETEHPLDL